MSKNNLPIKIILQKTDDIFSNSGGGKTKFFSEVTLQLQIDISNKFESLLEYYNDVFEENENIPAIGKVIVKPEAIAKSHKPDDLCRNCPIIGTEDLNEIYIKVKKKSIQETVKLVMNPPSIEFKANMTAVSDIQPIKADEKITSSLALAAQSDFSSIKNNIKVKIFDFDDDFDNAQIWDYINRKITLLGLHDNCELITYGEHIKFLKIGINSYEDIINIASINGVKSVDFFQEYSLPKDDFSSTDLKMLLHRIDKPRSAGFPHLPRERDGFADGRAHRHALQITRLIQPAAQNGAHRRIQLYQRLLQEFLQDMVQRHHTLYGAVEHGAEKCPVPRCSGEAVQRMAQYKVCVTVLFLFYQRGHGRAAGILHSCSFDSLPQPQAARALRACLFLYTAKAGNLLQFAGFAV